MGNHALLADVDVAVILIFVAVQGTAWMVRGYNVQQCKIEAFAEKLKLQEELSKKRLAEMQKKLEAQKAASATSSTTKAKKSCSRYRSLWKHLCSNQSGKTIDDS